MSSAIARGLAFLAAQQSESGFWEDWDLPVGSSRMWTTAYVGWKLSSNPCALARAMSARAADWLEGNELSGGGWGYAESTGADADSTALGILLLIATGRRAPMSALKRLVQFARPDGGFGTYCSEQSFGAWIAPHVEVTATAALALRAADVEADAARRTEPFLRGRRRGDGLWDSYWWSTPLYATEMSVRLMGDSARGEATAASRRLRPSNAFEEALRELILREASGTLEASQMPDGSWPSAPVLRLTRRDVFAPEATTDAGPCFADPRRIFTTATVLGALGLRPTGE